MRSSAAPRRPGPSAGGAEANLSPASGEVRYPGPTRWIRRRVRRVPQVDLPHDEAEVLPRRAAAPGSSRGASGPSVQASSFASACSDSTRPSSSGRRRSRLPCGPITPSPATLDPRRAAHGTGHEDTARGLRAILETDRPVAPAERLRRLHVRPGCAGAFAVQARSALRRAGAGARSSTVRYATQGSRRA